MRESLRKSGNRRSFALRGSVCYSEDKDTLRVYERAYVVCADGLCGGVYRELPERYAGMETEDLGRSLIVPGLVDLHIHAPQYAFRGLGMDMELLSWLNGRAFPEEERYEDLDYAEKAYGIFAGDMRKSATARACIFATIHREATELLMDSMEETGLKCMVGKVNMDRNSPPGLTEKSAGESLAETERWILETGEKYENVEPILTPRFVPSCTDELMRGLGDLKKRYGLPLQSHLSENQGEIDWVKELCPDAAFYGDAYDRFGQLCGERGTVMAHCVHTGPREMGRLKERGVYLAHCPQSNANLASGIAPVRLFLDQGMNVGLGSDVAGGSSASIFRAMADAVQASKLRWRLVDSSLKPLTAEEVFYLGTKGGGSFFGKTGSFEEGYEFDALVLDDGRLRSPRTLGPKERLERIIYLYESCFLSRKYVAGREVYSAEESADEKEIEGGEIWV